MIEDDNLSQDDQCYINRLKADKIIHIINSIIKYLENPQHIDNILNNLKDFPPNMMTMAISSWVSELKKVNLTDLLKHINEKHNIKPGKICYIIPGNIPLISWDAIVLGILLSSEMVIKVPKNNHQWLDIFIDIIFSIDNSLLNFIQIITEDMEDNPELYQDIFNTSDCIIVYGEDKTIESFHTKISWYKKFYGFGHKISISIIYEKDDLINKAKNCALDIWMYYQQGCLSPKLLYFYKAKEEDILRFCSYLSEELTNLYDTDLCEPIDLIEANQIKLERELALFNKGTKMFSDPKLRWTILYQDKVDFVYYNSRCFIKIMNITDEIKFNDLLISKQRYIQAVAIDVVKSNNKTMDVLINKIKVSRICPIGKLQFPQFLWNNEGIKIIDSLIHHTTVEFSKER